MKPEDPTAFYEEHPPNCIAAFQAHPDWLDNIDYDGHGFTGRYPDGLVANPNIVFAIRCRCGGSLHSIIAESSQEDIWYHQNLVIAERYFLECNSCHWRHLFFDRFLHGYDAEVFQMDGVSFDEYMGGTQPRNQNNQITCRCSNCKNTSFETFARFEYPGDLFDEPLFKGKEQEFFSWFTGIGKCKTCSTINLFIDFECA